MKANSAADSWVIASKKASPVRLRLFCFPYAGGGAQVFREWAEGLPSDVQVCSVQLPGRQSRLLEPPYLDLSELVRTLDQALSVRFDIPFAFFGHSMGALICFELARRLRRRVRVRPECLFIAGC